MIETITFLSLVLFGAAFIGFWILVFVSISLIKRMDKLKARHVKELQEARADAVKRSRSSIEGQVFEQLVPYFPEWKHEPSDARFIGTPIDFIVFDGMSKGKPEQITIVEVKKGNSSTTKLQNQIRDLIKEGKVVWELVKIK